MRVDAVIVVLLALLASIGPVTAQDAADIHITEVHPRPAEGGREFIELWNGAATDVDLAGWTLTDGVNTFTFDAWTLRPGDRVVVWGGGNASALGPVWKPNVWNNGGDTVTVQNPRGMMVDTMEYGTVDVPVPAEGMSLHQDGAWVEAEPTPGQDRQASGGGATATVDDLPPTVAWTSAPDSASPGDAVRFDFHVGEPNGDTVSWAVTSDDTEVTNGTTVGDHNVTATVPDTQGDWTWTLTATSTDHTVTASWTVHVVAGVFRITLPDAGITFPTLVPGATDVAASAPFSITQQGNGTATPHIDISPFQGMEATISVDHNMHLVVTHADGTDETVPYTGPLQPLPAMAPGVSVEVTLVIDQVPEPLPSGDYRTSFTVVA